MRFRHRSPYRWKRHFALWPIVLGDEVIWLEWVWRRFAGECYWVSTERARPRD